MLHALKTIVTLKNICIQFGAQFVDDPVAANNCYFPLTGFRNLTSLELYDFYSNHDYVLKDMAHVLRDSPFLKKLGLAFASEITNDDDEAILFGGPRHPTDFLERLCKLYGSTCKNRPLSLETLRLGHGIYLGKPSEAANSHYLTKLVAVESLQVLHVYNGLVKNELDLSDSCCIPVDWTPFTSEKCQSLRQLSVDRIEPDVTCWLRQHGKCVQELIVADHYSFNDPGLKEFFLLPPLQLSMLWMRERYPYRQSIFDDSDWTDTDSSTSDWTDIDSSDESTSESLDIQLSDSNPTRSGAAKSTAPKLEKLVMTVLDRLPDGGAHLTKLCIALDFETQWVSINT